MANCIAVSNAGYVGYFVTAKSKDRIKTNGNDKERRSAFFIRKLTDKSRFMNLSNGFSIFYDKRPAPKAANRATNPSALTSTNGMSALYVMVMIIVCTR